ncbi:MAG: M3 family peptidase, partial [Planctomycetaceae bacterium]|nr:M3 family peptidase [Planctomycetaceae bacterium]
MTDRSAENPLLSAVGLPPFDRIGPEHVLPAVKQLISDCTQLLEQVEQTAGPNWESIFPPLDEIGRRFERTWGPVSHLFGVKNSAELREAYEAAQPDVVEFGLRISQSEPIYKAAKGLRDGAGWSQLDSAQRRIVEQRVRSAELSGIGLTGDKRKRFNQIKQELSKLGTTFSNHLLDATKAYALVVRDPADADGLPMSLRRLAAQSFNSQKPESEPAATPEQGPWRITLDIPSYGPFLQHCRNRTLREEVYRAYMTRASSGELDNSEICRRILELRRELAQLLGYENYAQVSLAEKMAPEPQAVLELLEQLRSASWGSGETDMQEIHELAIASGCAEELRHWDVPFWAERLRERKFRFTDEDLRPYFPH